MELSRMKRITVISLIIVILAYVVFGQQLKTLSLAVYAALPILVGGLALVSIIAGLGGVDELQRRIQLEGLVIALGGLFLIYWVEIAFAEYGQALNFSPELHILFLAVLWAGGTLIARWRYR